MKQKSMKSNKTEPLGSGFENLWPSVRWKEFNVFIKTI